MRMKVKKINEIGHEDYIELVLLAKYLEHFSEILALNWSINVIF